MVVSQRWSDNPKTDVSSRTFRVMQVVGGHVLTGVETSVLTLAGALREAGDEVILVPLVEGPFAQQARDAGFTVEPLGKRCRYDVLSIPKLARLIKRRQVEIVHSHTENGAFYACPAGRLAGVRGQIHHFRVDPRRSMEDVYRWRFPQVVAYKYNLWLTRRCHRLITVNPELRQELIRLGVPAEKVVFVPNAIDLDKWDGAASQQAIRAELDLPRGVTVVGWVGRLAPLKNLPMLLRTVKRLADGPDDLRFLIVGDGPDRRKLERMTADLGIAGCVRFTGWRKDVRRILAAVDILALTSSAEAFGLVLLEAMAAAKPVVSTDLAGPRMIVRHDQTGLLVPPGDVQRMADAIRWLVRNKQQARRFGRAGRLVVEREFGTAALARRVRNVYADAMGQSHGCPRSKSQIKSSQLKISGWQAAAAVSHRRSSLEDRPVS